MVKLDETKIEQYINDEDRDLLRLSVLQEIKLDFYKLGAISIWFIKKEHKETGASNVSKKNNLFNKGKNINDKNNKSFYIKHN